MEKTSTNTSDGYGIYEYAGNIYFYVNNLNIRVSGVPYPAVNTYHHIAATYDRQAMRLYFDGALASSLAYSTAVNAGPGSLKIGKGWVALGWQGDIDEAALYDKALSADQVHRHYLAGTAGHP
jgi:hypothetical protein